MVIAPADLTPAKAQGRADDGLSGEKNFALERPATQSSISAFSRTGGASVDAAGAVRDILPDDFGFHTAIELYPWWQVDLGQDIEINRISIYNRPIACERFRHFSVLLSQDGERFETAFRKLDNIDCGADRRPINVNLPVGFIARYVRLRADAHVPLHLRRVEVFGSPADERAQSRERERVRQKGLAIQSHKAGRSGIVYDVGGFRIFGDSDRYSPAILGAFQRGDYEGREREVLRAILEADDRVLEVGCAVGAVAMTCAATVGADAVRCFDANPQMVEDARRNFAANGFQTIAASAAILISQADRARVGSAVEFLISKDFWSSRLVAGVDASDVVETILVPVLVLEEEIKSHSANVLVCDIEGGEIELLMRADLTGILKIILETHYWAVGKSLTSDLIRRLTVLGFDMDLDLSHHHVSYFRREKCLAPVRRSAWTKIRERIGLGF